jgi:hydrogenase 3 maturation protease
MPLPRKENYLRQMRHSLLPSRYEPKSKSHYALLRPTYASTSSRICSPSRLGLKTKTTHTDKKDLLTTLFYDSSLSILVDTLVEGIEQQLKDWFSDRDKVVVAGIGNPIRGDDYAGLKIAENLQNKVSSNVCVLECETVPENYLVDIEQFHPTHILLIDVALIGIQPGETKLVKATTIDEVSTFSSHGLSLRLFCEYITKLLPDVQISLLLIEPTNMDFGYELSPKVQTTVDKLTEILQSLLT